MLSPPFSHLRVSPIFVGTPRTHEHMDDQSHAPYRDEHRHENLASTNNIVRVQRDERREKKRTAPPDIRDSIVARYECDEKQPESVDEYCEDNPRKRCTNHAHSIPRTDSASH